MALKPCPECATEISDKATKCPKCGARVRNPKRGVIGQLFKWLFILFTLFMVIWLFTGVDSATDNMANLSGAERTGAEIGTGLGVMFVMFSCAIGTVIFGALAYFTRGKD